MLGSSADKVPLELPHALAERVDGLLAADRYYEAITLVRKETGASLPLGTRAVDHRQEMRTAG